MWCGKVQLDSQWFQRALTRYKTYKMYVAEERSLFVGEMWGSGEGEMMLGHSCLFQKKQIKEHRMQYTIIINEMSNWKFKKSYQEFSF